MSDAPNSPACIQRERFHGGRMDFSPNGEPVQARIHQPPAARRPTQPAKRCHSAGAGGSHDDRFLVGLGPEKLSWAGLRIGTRIRRPISAKMSLVARQLSDGLSATKCGSQNRKDVTDFHSCDPQKMSYEQGEACHLHTAPARRGFCAEMSQNQTPCNPIRASSLSQKMSRTCRCKNVWHFKCPSAKVAEDVTGTICGEPKVQLQPDCTNPFQAEGANAFSLSYAGRGRLERESCSRSAPRAWARAQNSATTVTTGQPAERWLPSLAAP